MPAALLARRGRATTEQVATHIEERMAGPRQRGFRARFAGRGAAAGGRVAPRAYCRGSRRCLWVRWAAAPGRTWVPARPVVASLPPGVGTVEHGRRDRYGAACPARAARLPWAARPVRAWAPARSAWRAGMGRWAAHRQCGGYGPADGAHETGLFGTMYGYDPLSVREFEPTARAAAASCRCGAPARGRTSTALRTRLSVNGDVRTTLFGADWARGPLMLGLSGPHARRRRLQRPERRERRER